MRLDIIAELTSGHAFHVLLHHNDVWNHRFYLLCSFLYVVEGMEVVDKLQASGDKLKEVEIIIDKDDIELSRRRFLTRTNFRSQLITNQFR